VPEAPVDDEVTWRVSKVTKGGLKLDLVVAEFVEVYFNNVESLEVSEVGESLEDIGVLGFVRRGVAHPLNVRRENLSPFLRDILAPPLELRLELETDVMEQMALALWKPSFRNESAGLEWSAEVATGYLPNAVNDPVDDFLVLEHRHVE